MLIKHEEVVRIVAADSGVSELKVNDVLKSLRKLIIGALYEGDSVSLNKLGVFKPGLVKNYDKEYECYSHKITPTFKATKSLRNTVAYGNVPKVKRDLKLNRQKRRRP